MRCRVAVGAMLTALFFAPPRASGNGNYTHVRVAARAVEALPQGDLRALLTEGARIDKVRSGAMFPDGGYALGDGYGEIAHWEPFHFAYLDWIRTRFSPPWTAEARDHIAFLMGMAAHGMSDQLYDCMYLPRYESFDQKGCDGYAFNVDGVTDSCFAASQGPMDPPEPWVPSDVLAPIFLQTDGHTVDAATLDQGQALVGFAVVHAVADAGDPAVMADYQSHCPWACLHQDDPGAPGSPVTHPAVIAAYWQVLWSRLHGDDSFSQPLLGTFFPGGEPWDQPVDAASPDSRISFALARGLQPSTVTPGTVKVTRNSGDEAQVAIKVCYGVHSHVVNLSPKVDWAEDASYTVKVSPPIASWDGVVLGTTHTFGFSTGPAPELPDAGEDAGGTEPIPD